MTDAARGWSFDASVPIYVPITWHPIRVILGVGHGHVLVTNIPGHEEDYRVWFANEDGSNSFYSNMTSIGFMTWSYPYLVPGGYVMISSAHHINTFSFDRIRRSGLHAASSYIRYSRYPIEGPMRVTPDGRAFTGIEDGRFIAF